MRILNLGCGGRTSSSEDVVNIDWSIALRLKRSFAGKHIVPYFLSGERLAEFQRLQDNILVHDLSKGIPFEDESVDVVYHSHMLEHLDREVVPFFMKEVRRVLRKGGIQRIVVPDLYPLVQAYIEHVQLCEREGAARAVHDEYIGRLIEQSVRRESYGTSQQKGVRRWLENVCFGDARKRGETHQWMYDKINLCWILQEGGFEQVVVQNAEQSMISNWNRYGLDVDSASGCVHQKHSLYIEAVK